jgi:beta-lactamase class D
LMLRNIDEGRASIGYWIVQSARGRGAATHALRAGAAWALTFFAAIACSHRTVSPTAAVPASEFDAPPGMSCFLLYELGVGEVRRSPAEACSKRVSPASTFKIPHALAALDSGILIGPNVSFAYDGAPDVPETWKRNHTLATAMRYSVVWYFQRVASLLGPDRERDYLVKFDYGSKDASSGLRTFWLDGSLKISPDEQERFLVRLYEDALPVSKDAMRSVRKILVQPPGVVVNAWGEHPVAAPWPEGTVLSAKTGSGDNVRWLVGHVERGRRWVFVSCVIGADLDALAAVDLAAKSLRAEHVL